MPARTPLEEKLWEKKLEDAEHPRVVWYWDDTAGKPKSGETQGPPNSGTIIIDGGSRATGDVYDSEKEVLDSRK